MSKLEFAYVVSSLSSMDTGFTVSKQLDGETVTIYQVNVNDAGYAFLCSCPTNPRNYPCKHMRMVVEVLRSQQKGGDSTGDVEKAKQVL